MVPVLSASLMKYVTLQAPRCCTLSLSLGRIPNADHIRRFYFTLKRFYNKWPIKLTVWRNPMHVSWMILFSVRNLVSPLSVCVSVCTGYKWCFTYIQLNLQLVHSSIQGPVITFPMAFKIYHQLSLSTTCEDISGLGEAFCRWTHWTDHIRVHETPLFIMVL